MRGGYPDAPRTAQRAPYPPGPPLSRERGLAVPIGVHSRHLTSLALAAGLVGLLACEGTNSEDTDAALTFDASAPPLDGPTGVVDALGSADAPSSDAPTRERRGVFVAQGYAGRVSVSCDDGQSWEFDREDALTDESGTPLPAVERCFDGVDCDHHPGRAKGVVFHHGWFVRTNGWGPAGGVRRSRNGVIWEEVLEGTTFGGIATSSDGESEGRVLLGSRTPRWSADDALAFTTAENDAISGWNVRRAGFAAGHFVIVGNDGNEIGVSSDGVRWTTPSVVDAECGGGIQNEGGIAGLGELMVIVGGNGSVCRSSDGGRTWSRSALPDEATPSSSDVISTGSELLVWTQGALLRSSDGVTWTRTATEPSVRIGAVARSAGGTFVGVRGGWNAWNEQQRFYRSADGVRWDELTPEAARRSHPIGWIAWGEIDASIACRE